MIKARATVQARCGGAVIKFGTASTDRCVLISCGTGTRIRIDCVCAGTPVETRGGGTFVHINITYASNESSDTRTLVSIHCDHA